jgi:CMP-N,N'-diacetyllegionaminic acid synthase
MNLNIIALIPARSGSKGIPDKNIKLYKGLPLLVHSINIAKESKYINDVYVSTDSKEYQDIALKYNSKVTPLRSAEISDDLSPDIDTFKFFLNSIDSKPDIIIHLRPTYPNRSVKILDDCIEQFIKNYNLYDSLRTVIPIKKCPLKMYYIENNKLIPYFKEYNNLIEPYNQARQNFPDTYLHNGCIDIVKTSIILNHNLLSGYSILPYIMDEMENDDIDDIDDFNNSINKKNLNI